MINGAGEGIKHKDRVFFFNCLFVCLPILKSLLFFAQIHG